MTAIEDARAALASSNLPSSFVLAKALRALIDEHERLTAPPTDDVDPVVAVQTWMAADVHSALGRGNITEPNDGDRSWADWWARLMHDIREVTAPPIDDEREALAEEQATLYAEGDAEAHEDFLTGWRTADRFRRQGPITDAQVEAASEAFGGITSTLWEDASSWEKEEVRAGMWRALEAARGAS